MNVNRDALINDLRANVIEVGFTKVNGEKRVMLATLREDMLPESFRNSEAEKKEEKDFHQQYKESIACWDVQKGGWRSFRVDSVEYVQAKDGYN